jgi:hypothetical protein
MPIVHIHRDDRVQTPLVGEQEERPMRVRNRPTCRPPIRVRLQLIWPTSSRAWSSHFCQSEPPPEQNRFQGSSHHCWSMFPSLLLTMCSLQCLPPTDLHSERIVEFSTMLVDEIRGRSSEEPAEKALHEGRCAPVRPKSGARELKRYRRAWCRTGRMLARSSVRAVQPMSHYPWCQVLQIEYASSSKGRTGQNRMGRLSFTPGRRILVRKDPVTTIIIICITCYCFFYHTCLHYLFAKACISFAAHSVWR